MNKKKLTKKEWGIFIIGMIIFIGSILLSSKLIFIKRQPACAMFYAESETRGTIYVKYIYKINDKKYAYAISISQLKVKNLDDLKQYDCVEIEYSMWFPSISRVVDKRILN